MMNIEAFFGYLRKTFSRKDVLIFCGIVVAYFLTRLLNIEKFPIFSDEGIYVRWAKVAWKDATWRFISLTDGRQPLQTWGTIPFLKLFETQALFAGRLFSVTTGFAALLGAMTLGLYAFNKRVAAIVGLLYVVTPYFLFYDRMALMDSGINAFTIWMFLLSIVMARTLRLDVALILGAVSGFALLGKSSVKLYVGLMLGAFVFVLFEHKDKFLGMILHYWQSVLKVKDDKRWVKVLNFLLLYGIVVGMAILIYNVQRLSPFMHYVTQKNTTFILTRQEILSDPFNYFSHNILNIPFYIFSEMGYVVSLLGLFGLYKMFKKDSLLASYIILWIVPAWFAISLVARVLFPRYVLSLGGLLLLPAAFALDYIFKNYSKKLAYIIVALTLLSVSYFNYTIWFSPKNIPFPPIDRGQYLEGWPAGWGIKEIMEYAREKSANKPVQIMAEGDFGLAGDVLDTYLLPTDNISIQGYWPLDGKHLTENQSLLEEKEVLVVFSHRSDFPMDWPIKLIKKYEKPCIRGIFETTKTCDAALYLFELQGK